jgi:hypothetical protein
LPIVRWFRTAALGALAVASAVGLATGSVQAAEKVLRVGMSAADIPINIGQPDQGFEGFRFMGYMRKVGRSIRTTISVGFFIFAKA